METMRDRISGFQLGLVERGYFEGRNVSIEHRWASGQADQRPAIVADLIRRQVSVIVADTTNGAAGAKAATQTIPIVFMAAADPFEVGPRLNLNPPRGNPKGIAHPAIQIMRKNPALFRTL